ncbi:MAG: DNA-processing protein DprA [Gammaproteobacteria bacterium]|nr:DNA-processing protein DprA [Gammaproteobacteria bacterium]
MESTYFPLERLPECLQHLTDAPRGLNVAGDPDALEGSAVAIVGSRRASKNGRELAHHLGRELAAAGLVVVSGLAHGIDGASHRGALAVKGRTVAVLGSGLGHIYPKAHVSLARDIVRGGGALVSEYAENDTPRKHHFPQRNRLISGLALGVIVVEATTRSGSLITARLAASQGREVMAVPGPVTSPLARGCHRLLKEGAALIEDEDDVLYALGLPPVAKANAGDTAKALAGALAEMLVVIGTEPMSLQQILRLTGLSASVATSRIVELELLGFVEGHRGGYIRRPFSDG